MLSERRAAVVWRPSRVDAAHRDAAACRTLMTAEATLVAATRGLQELASNLFYGTLSSTVQRILATMSTPDYDLMPVHAVHQVCDVRTEHV